MSYINYQVFYFTLLEFLKILSGYKMKEIIKKIINNTQITLNELNQFVVNAAELFEKKQPTAEELKAIVQLIQMHQFDLMYAVKLVCTKLDIPLRILYDKNGQLIKHYIQE